MRQFLSPSDPAAVDPRRITELKIDVVRTLIHLASGVMLEPEFSIPQISASGLLPPDVGFIAALEAQGYLADPATSITSVLAGWSPQQAAAAGASMAKLLLPYRPGSELAAAQEAVARSVSAECEVAGIPLVLEPMLWGSAQPDEQAALTVESVARFAPMRPGILKVPFPGLASACAEITQLCAEFDVPWALLSGGGTFERFEEQLTIAVAAGCSGFMVGRALWGEAALAAPSDRVSLLESLVIPRFERLNAIVALG